MGSAYQNTIGYNLNYAYLPAILRTFGLQGVSYTSSLQVQNLDGAAASVALRFHNPDGTLAGSNLYTIAANSSLAFNPIADVPAGFSGSLVVAADRPIRTIANLFGAGGTLSGFASTTGLVSGATALSLPLIMCNNNGFNTWFSLQNSGSADATLSIQYIPGSNGTAQSEGPLTLRPGAARSFSQAAGSSTVNCATLQDASGKFVGSANISSNQPLAAAVAEVNSANYPMLLGYTGFAGGSPTVALPMIMARNSGFYTSVQIQNVGLFATTVTLQYTPNTGGPNNPQSEVFALAAGAAKTISQDGYPPNNGSTVNDWLNVIGRYIGGANVTNSANQPLAVIVNQQRLSPTPVMGSSYEGFNPAAATAAANAPLIMANNSSYYTAVQIQNVSGGAASVTLHYGPNTGGLFAPQDEVFTLAAGSTKTIHQNGSPPDNGSTVNYWGTSTYIGSATLSASGGNIVAIVNQQSQAAGGDRLATYTAFNYNP